MRLVFERIIKMVLRKVISDLQEMYELLLNFNIFHCFSQVFAINGVSSFANNDESAEVKIRTNQAGSSLLSVIS